MKVMKVVVVGDRERELLRWEGSVLWWWRKMVYIYLYSPPD